jgi:hypothetical protein
MKIISQQECQQWLRTKLATDFTWKTLETNYDKYVTYELPIDAGKKAALARAMAASIPSPGLFWITAWGIFPSSQNMVLFDGYRESLGESRAIDSAPGHIFDSSDLQKLECLLDLTLYFYWDAGLFDGTGSIAARISHDECLSIYGTSIECLRDFEKSLGLLELKQLARSR